MRRFITFGASALLGCAVAAAPPEIRISGIPYTPAGHAAASCGMYSARNGGGTSFARSGESLQFTPEKPLCIYNGIKVHQCFPARWRNGALYVSRLDLAKTLLPLSSARTGVVRHRVRSITIDPGHGGRDQGAATRRLREKIATLLLASRVCEILRRCNYQVNLTRGSDRYVPLGERCRLQRAARSDLFVSIHVNAAANRSLQGIETYALTPAGAASTSGGKPSQTSFSGNRNDANNLLLAYLIQRALLRRSGAVDRGIKRARFAVLRDINAPGVLVEVGFLSNPREEQRLLDPAYREKLARGIAEGIVAYQRVVERK